MISLFGLKFLAAALILSSSATVAYAQTPTPLAEWGEVQVSESIKGAKCNVIKQKQSTGRAALIIGNSSYPRELGWLESPYNDAIGFAALALNLGFDVYIATDVDRDEIELCMKKIGDQVVETSILFYSGHGIQVGDVNYLIPIGDKPFDLIPSNLISLNDLVDRLRASSAKTVVFLDACRTLLSQIDGPRGLSMSTTEASELNSNSKTSLNQRNEFFITYATQPGNVASAGNGKFSPFTEALLEELGQPNVSIQEALTNVTLKVGELSEWQQQPFTRTTLSKMLILRSEKNIGALIEAAKANASDAVVLLNQGKQAEALDLILGSIPADLTDANASDLVPILRSLQNVFFTKRLLFSQSEAAKTSFAGRLSQAWISPDRTRLIMKHIIDPDNFSLTLIDTATGKIISQWAENFNQSRELTEIKFSADGSKIAFWSLSGKVYLYSGVDGSLMHEIKISTPSLMTEAISKKQILSPIYGRTSFSPSGKLLLIQGSEPTDLAAFVTLADTSTGKLIHESSKVLRQSGKAAAQDFIGLGELSFASGLVPFPPFKLIGHADVRLEFRNDDELCLVFNHDLGADDDSTFISGASVLYAGFWNWREKKTLLDTAIVNQKMNSYGKHFFCNSAGLRIFNTTQIDAAGKEDYDTGPSLQVVSTELLTIKTGADATPYYLSSDGLSLIILDGAKDKFAVYSTETGKETVDLSSIGLEAFDVGIYFNDGTSYYAGIQALENEFFNPPSSLPEMVDLALSRLTAEHRKRLQAQRP